MIGSTINTWQTVMGGDGDGDEGEDEDADEDYNEGLAPWFAAGAKYAMHAPCRDLKRGHRRGGRRLLGTLVVDPSQGVLRKLKNTAMIRVLHFIVVLHDDPREIYILESKGAD